MQLGQRSEAFSPPEDHSWLGSAHASDTWESGTLDVSSFTGTFTAGFVPSGVVISLDTGSGLYVRGSGGGGRVGHLATTKDISGGVDVMCAVMWHGQVIVDNLPANHGLDTDASALMPMIDYVGDVPAPAGP